MRTIYIDSDYKCHVANDGSMRAIETRLFDGRCKPFIEGCRYIPDGESWTREDGEVFEGESFFPWKDSQILELAQFAYEESLAELQDMQSALELLGVEPTEDTVGGE